jgi:hypothetical protein
MKYSVASSSKVMVCWLYRRHWSHHLRCIRAYFPDRVADGAQNPLLSYFCVLAQSIAMWIEEGKTEG